jgi:hypothetical protein
MEWCSALKNLITGLLLGIGSASGALAQSAGFSTFQISWSGTAAPSVTTMSTYALICLPILVAIAAYRLLRDRSFIVRALAPLVTFGVAGFFLVSAEQPIAGVDNILTPPIDVASCSGSATYTADRLTPPPPCFFEHLRLTRHRILHIYRWTGLSRNANYRRHLHARCLLCH